MSKKKLTAQEGANTFFIIVVIVVVLSWVFSSDEEKSNPVVAKQKPIVVVPKLGTKERYDYEVGIWLSDERNVRTTINQRNEFDITYDLYLSIYDPNPKEEAKLDIKYILIAIKKSGLKYSHVLIKGHLSLVDKFGNSSVRKVLEVSYDKKTINKINVDNFSSQHVYDVANTAWIHPAIR